MKSFFRAVVILLFGFSVAPAFASECVKVIGFDWSIPHKIDPANADSQAD